MLQFLRTYWWLPLLVLLAGGAAAGYFLYENSKRALPGALGNEITYPLNLEQRSPDGRIVLDKIWRSSAGADAFRISGRFIGGNPNEHYHIRSRIRDTPEGFENGGYSWLLGLDTRPGSDETEFLFAYARYPFATDKLYVRVYFNEITTGTLEAVSDFEFDNPFPDRKKISDWSADALPATKTVDWLEVTLNRVETGFGFPADSLGFRESYSRAYLTIKEPSGDLTSAWSVWGIHFSTASGISFRSTRGSDKVYGEARITTGGTLWETEGPWKLVVTLMLSNHLPPEDGYILPELVVPPPGQAVRSPTEFRIEHSQIEFLGISGGDAKLEEWGSDAPSSEIALYFRFPEQGEESYLTLLSVQDESGSELDFPKGVFVSGDSKLVQIEIPPQKKRPQKLQCVVGHVHEKTEVEFIVNPSFVGKTYLPEVGSR